MSDISTTLPDEQQEWLREFTVFMALKGEQGGRPWPEWPAGLRNRDPEALGEAASRLAAHRTAVNEEHSVAGARRWAKPQTDRSRR